jgi:hypothetical protein
VKLGFACPIISETVVTGMRYSVSEIEPAECLRLCQPGAHPRAHPMFLSWQTGSTIPEEGFGVVRLSEQVVPRGAAVRAREHASRRRLRCRFPLDAGLDRLRSRASDRDGAEAKSVEILRRPRLPAVAALHEALRGPQVEDVGA